MSLYPQAPLSIGGVLDGGFTMYRAVFKAILPLSIAVGLLSQAPAIVPYLIGGANPAEGSMSMGLGVGLLAGFLAWFVVYMAVYVGWLQSLDALARGGTAHGVGAAFSSGLPKVLPLLGSSLLFTLAVLVGCVLLVIPGLILMFSLIFFTYLIALDNKGPIEGLKESHKLVWGNWWRTVIVITIGGLIYFAIVLLIVGVVAGTLGVAGFGGPSPEQAAAGIGAGVLIIMGLQAVLAALLLPMWNSMMLVLYRDLQLRRKPG